MTPDSATEAFKVGLSPNWRRYLPPVPPIEHSIANSIEPFKSPPSAGCHADGGDLNGSMELAIECSIGGTGGKYLRQLGLKPTLNASVAESGVIAQKCRRSSQLRC